MIAESIAVAQKQQEIPRAELTSLELALFEDAEAEHSTTILAPEEQAKQSVSEPVDQAEQMVAVPEPEVKVAAAVPNLVVNFILTLSTCFLVVLFCLCFLNC